MVSIYVSIVVVVALADNVVLLLLLLLLLGLKALACTHDSLS